MELKIKKLDVAAKIPQYAHPGDAGLDLFSLEAVTFLPNTPTQVRTGVALEIPDGYVGLVWDKSGLAQKSGLKVLGGVVDAGYRGEVMVGIINLSKESYVLEKGMKVAQMLIQPISYAKITETSELSQSSRGEGGFGSTGK